jgi:hypothetical protein
VRAMKDSARVRSVAVTKGSAPAPTRWSVAATKLDEDGARPLGG